MVHVTERAKEALLQRKRSRLREREAGLRMVLRAGFPPGRRLTLVADRVRAGDQVVTHEDAPVLLVGARLAEHVLAGTTVDCREGEDGRPELILRRVSPEEAGPR
jgi:hypothetical protein